MKGRRRKIKPVSPSLRERKRYLAYEVRSEKKISDGSKVAAAIKRALREFVGTLGSAKAGLIVLTDSYNAKTQRGIARVAHNGVDALKASLTFITEIDKAPATIRSISVSGNINKAKEKLAN